MASAWNMFVKKIYWENKKKNKNFQFKDALKEASKRKGEMGSMGSMKKSAKKMKGGNYGMKNMKMMGGKKMRRGKSKKMRGGMNCASRSFGENAGNLNENSNDVQFRAGNAA